ncbi:hypothetical protein M407DRAFT_241426 [Tulasnella calospora MUT 4182]|uniref:Uncharacterized protein n=1 Tax=Tulasnella calospora MUT 4182 TaxID=1051891 RepID=A0A0C3QTL6_9AGAM|nr:hypothetical protein M407DRAFT_241426 [Tulasnella calospora MUT 4182]
MSNLSGIHVEVASNIRLKVYELFGGAIKMSLPVDLIDASTLRQVPDTQEVFLSKDTDISYIIEVLERVEVNGGVEAVKFHFNALADDNGATKTDIELTEGPKTEQTGPSPPAQPPCWTLVGTQQVPKFNKSTEQADIVKIFLLLWRVDAKQSDVVLTINVPIVTGSDGNAGGVGEKGAELVRYVWEKARASFKVEDFELFA